MTEDNISLLIFMEWRQDRTQDPWISKQTCYQLSYRAWVASTLHFVTYLISRAFPAHIREVWMSIKNQTNI